MNGDGAMKIHSLILIAALDILNNVKALSGVRRLESQCLLINSDVGFDSIYYKIKFS